MFYKLQYFSIYIQKLKTFIGLRFIMFDTENLWFLVFFQFCVLLLSVQPSTDEDSHVDLAWALMETCMCRPDRWSSRNKKVNKKRKDFFHQTLGGFCSHMYLVRLPQFICIFWFDHRLWGCSNSPLSPPKDDISVKPFEHFKQILLFGIRKKTARFPQCRSRTNYTSCWKICLYRYGV